MNIRKTVPLMTLIAFGGISPALADCCSSIWDCAAAVVSDGLSCEIETIISTIKTLVNLTNNVLSDLNGQTQSAENNARQSVTDAYNTMQSQSQQASADLAQAKSEADLLYHEENAIRSVQMKTVNPGGGMQATASSAPSAPPPRQVDQLRRTAGAPPPSSTPGNSLEQRTTATALTQDSVAVVSEKAPHGTYADAFSRGLKLITTLNATGSTDLTQVNQYLANALASEGPGVAAADTLAGAMRAPLNDIESQLSSMLTNPLSAFDPSNAVDSIENSVTANMSGNISQMIDDISAGPTQAFNAAGPTFDDLLSNAENAQAVAAAMDRLYKERTPGAANALFALLPKEEYAGLSTKATVSKRIGKSFGARVSSVKLKANLIASKQKILSSVRPLNVSPLHAAVAQFKAQRAQGKTAQSPTMLAMYRTNTTRQLDGYFSGKSPLAMATERDQLIAQARTKFAHDPKTGNGVIALIKSAAQKQGAAMTAAVPGQQIPTTHTGSATNAASPAAAATLAVTPSMATPSMAPTQQKVATWGAAPAWTPPGHAMAPAASVGVPAMTTAATAATAAPHVVTAIKPAIAPKPAAAINPASTFKTLQPLQRPAQQPASTQSAPSSMTTTP